jgi:hypothetical protein
MNNLLDMPQTPDHVAEAKRRGLLVTLMEDHLSDPEPAPHRTTARAVEAALVLYGQHPMPALVLADGSVVVLSWPQSFAVIEAFSEFRRVVDPVERDALGPTRASMELPS